MSGNWYSINQRASRLKIKRQWQRQVPDPEKQWTKEEEERLREFYIGGETAKKIADKLGRTERAIRGRASVLGIHRPKGFYPRKYQASWNSENIKVMQGLTSHSKLALYLSKLNRH